ncbi:type II secretion system protein GspE [Persicimonas caeni]|uniref:protein-secreting ATPase n=1 Tax=Persicimonas caeni TaxID=2292766 RepID=A0A4Y6PPC2_PERCE|nr:type II secretion system ATPase GspE [Persicimonas caeni]QDG50110.1 type II secretion system protein GspE [Persicimonas caeni]QED31331.1 type II secretion system protein GspE [Persicimonas caeni]
MYNRQRLGEILIQRGHVTADAVDKALRQQRDKGGLIGQILIAMEAASEKQVMEAVAEQLDYPFQAELDAEAIELGLLEKLQLGYSRENRVLPFDVRDGYILVATDDPLNVEALDEIRFLSGKEVLPVVVPTSPLRDAINKAFDRKSRQLGAGLDELDEAESPHAEDASIDINDLLDAGDDDEAPVIRFVNSLFVQAVRERASDIHIEPGEKDLTVRFRIDGVLKEIAHPPKRFHSSIITRVKIMAGLDIAEKRLPQDGRIRIKMAGKDIDIRVATAPAVHGERITMRLLDKSAVLLNVRDIGLKKSDQETLLKLIHRPNGIVLVTGPTGSGKTTTLYSSLSEINTPDKNILTIEDPVEYQLEGISQMQVNPKIKLNFATGLRSYLRHDPDVIMVGEIRDLETAEMAIQASLTGHLVFSTLHTNDAASAFTRLIDMGVEPFLVSSTVIASLAQRLVRRLCSNCKEPYVPDATVLEEVGLTKADLDRVGGHVFRAREGGCEECISLGYRGRTGIYEVLSVEDSVRNLIMNRDDASNIKREACNHGMDTLREDGAVKILQGQTSIEEVLRVTQEDSVSEAA